MEYWVVLLIANFVFAMITMFIASSKGHSIWLGLLSGFFLGIVGLIIVSMLPNNQPQNLSPLTKTVQCPYCKEEIKYGATICKHCQSPLENSDMGKFKTMTFPSIQLVVTNNTINHQTKTLEVSQVDSIDIEKVSAGFLGMSQPEYALVFRDTKHRGIHRIFSKDLVLLKNIQSCVQEII